MANPVLIQGIGLIALFIGVSIFQTNKRKTMLILGMCCCLMWSLHFLLLGATTGAFLNLIGAGRCYAFYKVRPNRRNRWVLGVFMLLLSGATFLTWQSWISLLPFVASVTNVMAYWQRKPKYIRRLALIGSPPWLVYDAISGSYPGVAVEILQMTSDLIGQYRFDFRHASHRTHGRMVRAAKPA